MQRVLDPIHTLVYFAPEAKEEYAALGLEGAAELYFPARAAPLGVVPWQVVQATFFNFAPIAVQLGIERAWVTTTPPEVTAARMRGVDRALQRVGGDLLDDVAEALDLSRAAAAACQAAGRPLYAGTASLPEPAEPHLALWHQLALLREYRGDGHVAVLVSAGLTAEQSLVLYAAYAGPDMARFLQKTRGWTPQEWAAAAADLVARGWIDDAGALTNDGWEQREALEVQTDVLALSPWEALGAEGCARLQALMTPLSTVIRETGAVPGSPVRR